MLSKAACSVFLGMGESNCAWNRKALLHRETMLAAAAVYGGKERTSFFAASVSNWAHRVYPLTLPVLVPFLWWHHQVSCLSFQNTDPIAPDPPSRLSLLFLLFQSLTGEDFSCDAPSESWGYPNIRFLFGAHDLYGSDYFSYLHVFRL